MNRNQRIAIVIGGLVAAVVAFVALNPGDDSGDDGTATAPTITNTVTAPPTTTTTTTPSGTTTSATPPPAPAAPLLTKGKVREIKVSKDEIVRFRVRSSVPEEVHVHGYDITSQVAAGETVRLAFQAKLHGIFEIELHKSHTQIGKLVVEP